MIVATAGHVDHGKTSLVKALTGVDTDKLEEEKRRGLTIDLGFAYRSVKEGVTLGFVDVPGHSRFINTMIAGVSGIDLGLLVVAADDGPMPQTMEHLELMRILGIPEFAVVVTKVDRVDTDRVAEVIGALNALVPECEQAAFCVSNASGAGLPELQAWLDERALAFDKRKPDGNFRMPVDRAFSLKGVGMVVTGTAIAGRVAVGEFDQPRVDLDEQCVVIGPIGIGRNYGLLAAVIGFEPGAHRVNVGRNTMGFQIDPIGAAEAGKRHDQQSSSSAGTRTARKRHPVPDHVSRWLQSPAGPSDRTTMLAASRDDPLYR